MTVQLSLPGQAYVAEGAIDHNGMYAMHFAFRRDLTDLLVAAERTPVDDVATWTNLRDYWELFAELLHHHHTAEDDVYWPALVDAVDAHGTRADREIVGAMEDEHASIGPALDRCRRGFELVLVDPSPARQNDLRDSLVDARRIVGTLVPWVFHGMPDDAARQLVGLAPPPQRLLLRLTRRRFARRHGRAFAYAR